jgi:hypothetical protein
LEQAVEQRERLRLATAYGAAPLEAGEFAAVR